MKVRMNKDTFLKNFIKERNDALFSLDEEKIKAYFKKYKIGLPENPKVFWASVYKAIYNITDAPQELKDQAKAWLGEHRMSTRF